VHILSWNVRRATARSAVWDYFLECSPDLALLQEVNGWPERVSSAYECRAELATGRSGAPQTFRTAILARGQLGAPIPLRGGAGWLDAEIAHFSGNLVANRITTAHTELAAISVYSPAWPVDPARLAGIDVSDVRLKLNRDVWLADVLWAALRAGGVSPADPWVVGGDFNLSETFDQWRGGPRGNREYLDRMIALGFVECLRTSQGGLTPTYRNTDKTTVKHQMDHLFVSRSMATRLRVCNVGSPEAVFGRNLSDHLPIIADFTPV
jgi:endonuclease/exonuclease/phosphatase family metal-dependent hydrolase